MLNEQYWLSISTSGGVMTTR